MNDNLESVEKTNYPNEFEIPLEEGWFIFRADNTSELDKYIPNTISPEFKKVYELADNRKLLSINLQELKFNKTLKEDLSFKKFMIGQIYDSLAHQVIPIEFRTNYSR